MGDCTTVNPVKEVPTPTEVEVVKGLWVNDGNIVLHYGHVKTCDEVQEDDDFPLRNHFDQEVDNLNMVTLRENTRLVTGKSKVFDMTVRLQMVNFKVGDRISSKQVSYFIPI